MTLEQELELQNLLKQWRDERHLSIKSQRDGLIGNLCEEMAEYYRATNNDEKIDALCDMYVFCMNSLDGDLNFIKDGLEIDRLTVMRYILPHYRFYLLGNIETSLRRLKNNINDFNFTYIF